MNIQGFTKTTLLDYPGKIAAVIFLGGCNFRCPFCHNASLVLSPDQPSPCSLEDILNTLKKRRNLLDGVCISGGEPTLAPDLPALCQDIKSLGYSIKLDTNGTNPGLLKELAENKLIDYAAMVLCQYLPLWFLKTVRLWNVLLGLIAATTMRIFWTNIYDEKKAFGCGKGCKNI